MIKFMGHASIYIKTDKVSIITDPWFSKTGAFQSSWFQFPDNTEINFRWKKNLDYVCISHEHQDHYDINFLKTLSKNTKIVIPNYVGKRFFNSLQNNLDNEIIEVNNKEKYLLGDVEYYPIIQIPLTVNDSAMVFKFGDDTILNMNDMKMMNSDIDWVRDNFIVDYLFTQFSGASWYPIAYTYNQADMNKKSYEKRLHKYKSVIDFVKKINPTIFVPCAGPPCFLSEVFPLNFISENTFPTQDEFYEYLKINNKSIVTKTAVLVPEDEVYFDMDVFKITTENLKKKCFSNKREYIEEYREKRRDIIDKELNKISKVNESLLKKCQKYFYPLMFSAKRLCKEINCSILLNVIGNTNEKIIIDFTKRKNAIKLYEDEEVSYEFMLDGKYLNLILDREITWEQLFLSLRFKAKRHKDSYNEHLMAFLKLTEPIAYKNYEEYHFKTKTFKTETFDLTYKNKLYKVQKYCPHASGDLSEGTIEDGVLTCPLHLWKFSLEDGGCLNHKSKITIKEVK